MNESEFHEERRKGIFSTDLAPLLGLDRYGRGPLDVAVRILRGYQQPQNESMGWGKRWEPILKVFYEEETGAILDPTPTFWHPTVTWAGAHGDYWNDPDGPPNRLVDCKWTTIRQGWGEPGTDQVPADIVVQMQ